MKVSGFTFLKNASLLGYPFIESIQSVLPICDEFIVAVGESDDETLQQVRAIGDAKLRILETKWNEKMIDRGYVYAQQKMIANFNCTGDWAFYLEADEVLHEEDLPTIHASMERHLDQTEVEALVFDYYHFYGSPEWLAISPGWYRRAPRIIRNTIRSYSPDGLFFVVMDKNKKGRYPNAALACAPIYHYGHVRRVDLMREKVNRVSQYWGHEPPEFKHYAMDPDAMKKFEGSHPQILEKWFREMAEISFKPDSDYVLTTKDKRYRLMMKLEKKFGLELSKKHFNLVK